MKRHELVQTSADLENFLSLNMDVRSLALGTTTRLMNHDPGVGQAEAFAFGTGSQEEGAHTAGLTNAHGADIRLDKLHGVVNRHARGYGSTGRIDVQVNILVRVLRLQKQKLGHHQVSHIVLNGTHQENNPLFQQARVDVIGALTSCRLLDDHRDQTAVDDL